MAVPKRKTSQARTRKRRAHDALTEVQRVRCQRCNSWMIPHTICETCGHYRGKALLPVEEI
ncbi:MAG: 50S ribosomal protein L32 [Planctomycetota bacterium]